MFASDCLGLPLVASGGVWWLRGALHASRRAVASLLCTQVRFTLQMSLCLCCAFYLEIGGEREKGVLLRQLRTFRFERVKCSEEVDRAQVRQAIEELYADANADESDRSVGEAQSTGGAQTDAHNGAGIARFEHDVQCGDVYHAVECAIGRQTGILGSAHVAMAFLPNLYRAFAYFPQNLQVFPNLFLFHGVVLMCVSPLCRAGALRLYLQLPRWQNQFARALGCVACAALFSALVLLTSFPALVVLKLLRYTP